MHTDGQAAVAAAAAGARTGGVVADASLPVAAASQHGSGGGGEHGSVARHSSGGDGAAAVAMPLASSQTTATTTTTVAASSSPPPPAAVALEHLEHQYVEVMRVLATEPQLEQFKNEYEKLHRLLLKSHEGEKRMLAKARELRAELDSHHAKIDTAMQLAREDEERIAALRKEIEKAWAMADTAHAREQESREAVLVLKSQVAELDALVEQNAGLSMGQETYLRDMLATRKSREDDNAVLRSKLAVVAAEHRSATQALQRAQAAAAAAATTRDERHAAYEALLRDVAALQQRRAARDEAVRQARLTLEQNVRDAEQRATTVAALQREVQARRADAAAAADTVAALQRELDEKQQRCSADAQRLAAVEQQNASLQHSELPRRAAQLADRQRVLQAARQHCKALQRAAAAQQDELRRLVRERDAHAAQSNRCSVEVEQLLAEVAAQEKRLRAAEAELKTAMQRKTNARNATEARASERVAAEGRRVFEEGKRRKLQQALEPLLTSNEQLRKHVFQLEQAQQQHVAAAQAVVMDYHKALDRIRSTRGDAAALRDVAALHERKQKTQQELLDRVTADRNRTEKLLRDAELELQQLQHKHASKRDELAQLHAGVVDTEAALRQLHVVQSHVNDELARAEQRTVHVRDDVADAQARAAALRGEVAQLSHVVATCDAQGAVQQQRLHALTSERGVLAAQLLRRDAELRLLYDKAQLQDSALAHGARALAALHALRGRTRDVVREERLRCRLALARLRYVARLRQRELHTRAALQQQRVRVRALRDEVARTANVHRWRTLEGSAPELLDGVAKVQLLQQRLLRVHDATAAARAALAQRTATYASLRRALARLPGPEAAEQLALLHENVRKRDAQHAGMCDELHDVEQHAELLVDEVHALQAQLSRAKQRYFTAKTRHDALTRERQAVCATWRGAPAVARLALAAYRRARRTAHNDDDDDNSNTSRSHEDGNGGRGGGGDELVRLSQRGRRAQSRQRQQQQQQQQSTTTASQSVAASEQQLLQLFSMGVRRPEFALQKSAAQTQRVYVGGGFLLTR